MTPTRLVSRSKLPRSSAVRRTPKRSSPLTRWFAAPALAVTLVTAFGACGSGTPSGLVETESIAECDTYASAYGACMARLGAVASAPADRHLMTLRQEVAATPTDDVERERLRSSCVFGLHQLELACR